MNFRKKAINENSMQNKNLSLEKDSNDLDKDTSIDLQISNLDPIMARAWVYLEDNNFNKALEYAENALERNPKLGAAYLIRLMASFKENSLFNLLENKILLEELENNKDFQKAQEYSSQFTTNYINSNMSKYQQCRFREAGLPDDFFDKMTKDTYSDDIDEYRKIINHLKDRHFGSYKAILEKVKDKFYCEAKKLSVNNRNPHDLDKAIKIFQILGDYKTSVSSIHYINQDINAAKSKVKKNKIILIVISCLVSFILLGSLLYYLITPFDTINKDGFVFVKDNYSYTLKEYSDDKKTIVVPSKIRGLPVTKIDICAFCDSEIESITISNSVKIIGRSAFMNVTSLKTVTFEQDSQLVNIQDNAFYGTTSLESIIIPNSVRNIGISAFENATGLRQVTFEENSQLLSIQEKTFKGASSLISIGIPSNVISIGQAAFQDATSLRILSFETNSQLKSIGDYAFAGATNLTSINLPNGLTSIGVAAFLNLYYLQSITIPNTVLIINYYAFSGASWLRSVTFEANSALEEIRAQAFHDAYNLESIIIPISVKRIDNQTFEGATSLTIYVEAASKPFGWEAYWNSFRPVVWGYTGD